MPDINTSYQWAIDKCNSPTVGYSQDYRNEQTIDGITYYDCSSFIWYALIAGGFDVVSANGGDTWAFTTYTMHDVLVALGFTVLPITDEWKAGDIVWRGEHTEFVYQGYRTMGAHTDKYALADQVSINDYEASTSDWAMLYRYGAGASGHYEWIIGDTDEYFEMTTMQNNAMCVYNYFIAKGWTVNAIAGLCGNIQRESTFNPALLEQGYDYPVDGLGTGLVQWTPVEPRETNPNPLRLVFNALGYDYADYADGNKQCDAIYAEYQQYCHEVDRGIEPQWYTTPDYPIPWQAWATSTAEPEELASVFLWNYERPNVLYAFEEERRRNARNWYTFFQTIKPSEKKKKKMPVWMMCRRWY